MLKLANPRLSPNTKQSLSDYQTEVDNSGNYPTQVREAKRLFQRRNSQSNSAFKEVRLKLSQMCRGSRRCMYCEDSVADEVEHLMPKDLYPELVFAWRNYLYSCGPCNGPKNNQFSVITPQSQLVDVTRPRPNKGAAPVPIVPPLKGKPALIDPRRENPMDLIILDLKNTFEFTPTKQPGSADFLRADFTIRVLHLNIRDYLISARWNAFSGYRARLVEYVQHRGQGASASALRRLRDAIRHSPHPTVWAEIVRQQLFHPEFSVLFAAAPEALAF